MWPTVTSAAEAPNLGSNKVNGPKSLIQVAREIWPTPTQREWKGARNPETLAKVGRTENNTLSDKVRAVEMRMFPTPIAGDYKGHSPGILKAVERHKKRGVNKQIALRDIVRLLPTPIASAGNVTKDGRGNPLKAATGAGGQLSPNWVEWLMGFPIGWTVLKPSATPSSLNAPKSSPEPSN